MAAFQIESSVCTGRGFADTAPSGFMAKFYNWVTKPPASGGPGWYILRDRSTTPTAQVYVPDINTDICTCSGHGFMNGEEVFFTTTGTNPGGIQPGGLGSYPYVILKVDDDHFRISYSYSTMQYLYNNQYVDITTSGTGTQYVTRHFPYIIVSDTQQPHINQTSKIMQFYYYIGEAGYVRARSWLGWNDASGNPLHMWAGYTISTLDSSDFAYDFRGGDECLIIHSRIGTSWECLGLDTWTGDANLLEGPDKSGWLVQWAQAGSGVVLTLNSSGAYNFTSGEYYYMYNLVNPSGGINYSKCTNVNAAADQITLEYMYYNYPSGSVIGSYPHRYCMFGNRNGESQRRLTIPYVSSTTSGTCGHNQSYGIYNGCGNSAEYGMLGIMSPNDKGQYAMEKLNIREYYRANDVAYPNFLIGMNRAYGSCNNIYITLLGSMSRAQDGRVYGGDNFLYIMRESELVNDGSSSYAALIPDTEYLS